MDSNAFQMDGNTNPASITAVPSPVVLPHAASVYTTGSILL